MGMQTKEGHLGGYVMDKIAPGTRATEVWDWIMEEYNIKNMVDVGCGLGHTPFYFKKGGCEVLGIERSPSACENSVISENLIKHDYTTGPLNLDNKYDLVWSAEFVEHVEEKYADNFLETFKSSNKLILITFAPPGQSGHHHVNCKPAEYWIRKIESLGFKYSEELTLKTRRLLPNEIRGQAYRKRGLFFIKT